MWNEQNGIMGHGYEGRTAAEYIADLTAWDVDILVDVRLSPISRKKGLSKTALSAGLAEAGIKYVHMPELGNPKDNREGFGSPGTPEARAAHARFEGLLNSDKARDAVEQLATWATTAHVVLLCFEQSERCCHRAIVLDHVRAELASLLPA